MTLTRIFTIATIVTGTLAAGAPILMAQSASSPSKAPAYYVAEYELKDAEGFKPYREQVDPTFERYGGRYIVRGGQMEKLEGNPPTHRMVVIAFDSMDQARAWYHSPEYAKIRPFRQKSGITNSYIVEGLLQ